jgi:hypothetical protein
MQTTLAHLDLAPESAGRLVVSRRDGALTARPVRRRDLAFARLLAHSLDRELAEGRPPEARWLRAVRASLLTDPATRLQLASDWQHAVARSRTVHGFARGTVTPRGLHSADADDLVDQLARRLSAPVPVPVRGAAKANLLLTDGSGPIYRPQSPEHPLAALADVIRHLVPEAGAVDVSAPGDRRS